MRRSLKGVWVGSAKAKKDTLGRPDQQYSQCRRKSERIKEIVGGDIGMDSRGVEHGTSHGMAWHGWP